jgi:orotidine-5'-phosphate decarboxylase
METMQTFIEKLLDCSRRNDSLVCVGLDIDLKLAPPGIEPTAESIFAFNRTIIEATRDLVCAYKPNLAFYEALGLEGLEALRLTVRAVPDGIPVIADAKRGDIGNTAQAYASALFDYFGFDATTVNPYLGGDAVQPFLEYRDKGVICLCKTSNPSAGDFQDLIVVDKHDGKDGAPEPLYVTVARRVRGWDMYGNCGLVVGATYPEELRTVRAIVPEMPILIPGIGAQAGDLELAVKHGVDTHGELAIINSSRQIIYASRGSDFAAAARSAAEKLRDSINQARRNGQERPRHSRESGNPLTP